MSQVLEVLDRLGIEYDVQRDEAFAHCPQHKARVGKEDAAPSWSINVETGLHNCFSCGYSGGLAGLVYDVQGFDRFSDAKEWIGSGEIDPQVTVAKVRKARLRRAVLPTAASFDVSRYLALPLVTDEFAHTRGLGADLCNEFGLRMKDDRWIIPIHHPDGTLMGWQEKGPGVFNNYPMGVRKGLSLFGFGKVAEDAVPVVVESPLDAVLAHQCGFPAVATYGTRVTDEQVALLAQFPSVILAFDNDRPGYQATEDVGDRLRSLDLPWFRIVQWGDGAKDFGDAPDRISEWVQNAVPQIKSRLSL